MKITKRSGGWLVAILLAVIVLGGCSATPGTKVDVSTPAKVTALKDNGHCDVILAAKPKFDSATRPNAATGERRSALRDLGFTNPDDTEAITAAKTAFDAAAADCLKRAISPSPSATATATATTEYFPLTDTVGWDQVVKSPPSGLKADIDAHSDALGFNWSDVEAFSKVRDKDSKLPKVRVVLVDGNAVSDPDARKSAPVGKNVPVDDKTPVVHVASCASIVGTNGCPSGASVRVILAPFAKQPDGSYAQALRPGSGVIITSKEYFLVTYQQ